MALTIPGAQAAFMGGLSGASIVGASSPSFALGISIGLVTWVATVSVETADVGTAGAGAGTTVLVVPAPTLLTALQEAFPAAGLVGAMAPALATGLSNGFATAFPQANVITTHPTVGTGSGVAKFIAPPAITAMQEGLASQGMTNTGALQIAGAISTALTAVFSVFTIPVVIVGPSSSDPSTGVGTGKIV
jgi:hypothetical protein